MNNAPPPATPPSGAHGSHSLPCGNGLPPPAPRVLPPSPPGTGMRRRRLAPDAIHYPTYNARIALPLQMDGTRGFMKQNWHTTTGKHRLLAHGRRVHGADTRFPSNHPSALHRKAHPDSRRQPGKHHIHPLLRRKQVRPPAPPPGRESLIKVAPQ